MIKKINCRWKIYRSSRNGVYLLLILIPLYSGCGNIIRTETNSENQSVPQPSKDIVDENQIRIERIIEKDIFTPYELRRISPVEETNNIIAVEEIIPQKLFITGIVFNGVEYLVSVENPDIKEFKYLKLGENILQGKITDIKFNKIKVNLKGRTVEYNVGDSIPIPGSSLGRAAQSDDDSDLDSDDENNGSEPIRLSADNYEEYLRQRRLQQEELLQ